MSVIMDNRLDTEDKNEEVKKLQELVKELKLQNEELRSERESLLTNTKGSDCIGLEKNEKESDESEKKENLKTQNEDSKSRHSSVESIPLELNLALALSDYQSSDDETWLFDSPKTKSYNEGWLRKDLDDPSLVIVKKSLVKKLDEIANSPHHSPRHSLYSPSSSSGVLSPESPPSSKGEIDSRTFIRPKKRRPLAFERFSDENRNNVIKKEQNGVPAASHVGSRSNSREYLGRSNGSLGSEEEDRLSSASDGSYTSYRLTDVEDVNTLARLQEESLNLPDPPSGNRMSPGTRLPSNMKEMSPIPRSYNNGCVRTKAGSSGDSATSSQEDLLSSPPGGTLTNGRRLTPRSGLQPPRKYSSGLQYPSSRSREGSDMSTPPDSPYNSQQNLETYNGKTVGSRLPSLTRRLGGSDPRIIDQSVSPNTSRITSPLPFSPHDSKSGSSSDLAGQGRISRLQAPQARMSRLSAPSPVRIPYNTSQLTQISPSNSTELLRSKPVNSSSGLPRPGSRLQPPKPRMSEASAKLSSQSDWREGCY